MSEEIRQLEVRMLRWSDSSTAGRTATFELDPLDGIEHPLRHFPSGAKNGQRFRVLIAPIADDESSALPDVNEAVQAAPVKVVDPSKSERAKAAYRSSDERTQAAMRAGRLRSDHGYQNFLHSLGYLAEDKEDAARAQHVIFGVKSSVEFQTDDAAYRRFLDHEHQYAIFTGREPEPR